MGSHWFIQWIGTEWAIICAKDDQVEQHVYAALGEMSLHGQAGTKWGHFTDSIFKSVLIIKIVEFWFKFHWVFFPEGSIENKSSLVQVMAWLWTCNKSFREPVITVSLMNIVCITRPTVINLNNFVSASKPSARKMKQWILIHHNINYFSTHFIMVGLVEGVFICTCKFQQQVLIPTFSGINAEHH